MTTDIIMPRLSDSMTEGVILAWLKADGDLVARGDELVEVETDKATVVYEADAEGFLSIVARQGMTLPVGTVIARLVSEPGEPHAAGPESEPGAEEAPASAEGAGPDRINASPLARRHARELGIDIATVTGSGRGGRIVKADIDAVVETTKSDRPADPAPDTGAKGDVEMVEPLQTQMLIARRMTESKATVPEFTITLEVDAEALFAVREQLRSATGQPPSVNDFVIKAAALALRRHPRANGSWRNDRFEIFSRVNVGMAVALEHSLVVPTIFDADEKAVGEIAQEARRLAACVRDGTITPSEVDGGTFTVSNLGMFGVTRFTAIVNPPQAAILAVGAAIPRIVPGEDGAPCTHRVMELTLSADHRVLYGSDAAMFLTTIRDLLENPARLLV